MDDLTLWRESYQEFLQMFDGNALFDSLLTVLRGSQNTFAVNRKLMQKVIDASWVEAIEIGLSHVDNVLRNPRRTIEDVEEIVPIALSRKITVDSVKHLAQHTDFIQSVDRKTGKVTPSKILNIHKEESLMTYENKFVNTLIERLYIFINMRYEKLAQVSNDEEVYSLEFDTQMEESSGGRMKIEVKLETSRSLAAKDRSGFTVWQRVEKLKKAIEGYKGSELCKALGTTYIRPPVMRTNAIMKNVDLKACLTLWQFIESYDKVGYAINMEDAAVQPRKTFINDFYQMAVLNMLLFQSSVGADPKILETREVQAIEPLIEKRFGETLSDTFKVSAEGTAGYIAADGDKELKAALPQNLYQIFNQIEEVIQIERNYQADRREKIRAAQEAAEAQERRRIELEQLEAARQAELERIRAEKEEQERQVQEMLAQKRAEQERERIEREKMEQERLALIEEKRRQAEEEARIQAEENKKLEEARREREEAERQRLERERIKEEKKLVRMELGLASGLDEEELELPEEPETELPESEFEDTRSVAERHKLEQQRREKERAETERAQRLKAERQYFENKSFYNIRKEYSKYWFYVLVRLVQHILVMVFGIIPQDTDNPDYKKRRMELFERRNAARHEREQRMAMEVYYRKYASSLYYQLLRSIDDYKFKKKKRAQMKNKPRPVYKPPVRTKEETLAIQKEMQRLYKTYHVSVSERVRRWIDEFRRNRRG